TLYNSIYRFDDDMFVNTHVYGSMAAHAPVLHLRRLSGGDLFDTYSESFDVIWNESKPATWTS
ncbi:MAG: XRE family transcriptional regulator, partial [Pseudonocardiaceae bacterium]